MTRNGDPPKARIISRVGGCSTQHLYSVHNSSIDNLARGVLERVFYVKIDGKFQEPPQPKIGVVEERLSEAKHIITSHLQSAAPVEWDSFPGLYVGRQKTRYENAVANLMHRGLRRKDAYVQVFTKAEKTDFTAKPDPAPRVISPRTPEYNVVVGSYIKPLEHKYCEAVAALFGHKTVFKGLNADEAGMLMEEKWRMFKRPVAVSLDATRFDQHVSYDMLKWEHSILSHPFQGPEKRKLLKYLSWQLVNKCYGYCRDGKLKYTVRGRRCSGDMNTGIGNCIDMSSMVYAYSKHCGVQVQLANNGDDCVVIMESHALNRFVNGLSKWFTEMGFTMKIEKPVYELEHIEFCQTHPVLVGSNYRMVRVPQVAMEKDSISLKRLDRESLFRKWLTVVGQGGLALNSGVPVMQEFYKSFIRNGRNTASRLRSDPTMETGMMMLARGMEAKHSDVLPETRYSYWRAFGVTPDEQMAQEGEIMGVSFDYNTVDDLEGLVSVTNFPNIE